MDTRMALKFQGMKHLAMWLRGHPKGQSLFHELTVQACEACRHNRRPVLVILYGDGWVELRGMRMRFVELVVPVVTCKESERLAEDYVVACLRPQYRGLLSKSANHYIGSHDGRTASDELMRRIKLNILRELKT